VGGAAGDIVIGMAPGTLLRLNGVGAPGAIDTSSGSDTGGRIVIGAPRSELAGNPFAIISTGGSITALGERGGANVVIETNFFIRSSDRANIVAVDGDFLLEATADDVSSGTSGREVSVIDASRVLRGQCPAARASGQLSQFSVRPVGPYAAEPILQPVGSIEPLVTAGLDNKGGCS
jgi:hypothetical protein